MLKVARRREKFTVLCVQRARSDERVVSRFSPPNLPCGKKNIFSRGAAFSKSSLSLSSSSLQLFSAVFFCSSFQQLFSTALLSSFCQQLFSAALLSSFVSSSSQQPFSAAILSYHLAVARGWWSAINIILLWSGVGGQLLTSSCCGQGLVVSYEHFL